jgi:threonine synthase
VFDIVGRSGETVRALWKQLDESGSFDLAGTAYWEAVAASGFVSGRSTHADRLATIRGLHGRTGVVIDPHTADGVKVAREHRTPGVTTVCLETAAPAKFAETIVEAIGSEPERPAVYRDIESHPQRVEVMPVDVARLKAYIEANAGA